MRDPTSDLRLPPLNALRAFEAAGRLQSIRRAAAELVVTPGAVSRHVRLLESWLGVPLFRRSAHSVTLTPAGAQYLSVVSAHLYGIATATNQIAAGRPDSRLKIRTWTLFASWLIPRLPDFRSENPGMEVQLLASSQRADFCQSDVDVEIIGCDTWDEFEGVESDSGLLSDPNYDAVVAVSSDLVCVCSPSFLEGRTLEKPADLKRIGDRHLLHSLSAPELWDRWLRAAGIEGLDSRHGQLYGDSALTASAARAGQGVAILPRMILTDDFRDGRLTVPFENDHVNCRFNYYLLAPPERFQRRRVQVFRDWLVRQAA